MDKKDHSGKERLFRTPQLRKPRKFENFHFSVINIVFSDKNATISSEKSISLTTRKNKALMKAVNFNIIYQIFKKIERWKKSDFKLIMIYLIKNTNSFTKTCKDPSPYFLTIFLVTTKSRGGPYHVTTRFT